MARLNSIGFELNSATSNVEISVSSTPSISSTTFRSGAFAGRISSLGSGVVKAFNLQWAAAGAGGDGPIFARFYLNVATRPSAANRISSFRDTTAAAERMYLKLNADGSLALFNAAGTQIGSDSGVLSTDTWYLVEMKVDKTAADGSEVIEAKLDGVVFATSSAETITGNVGDTLRMGGNLGGEAQTTGDWFFDDAAVNDSTGSFETSYPGEGEIIHLRPNAAGDTDDWDLTTTYEDIDENPPDDATTIITSVLADQVHEVELDDTPAALASDDVINAVHVGVRFNQGTVSGTDPVFVLRIKSASGGTVEESANITASSGSFLPNSATVPRKYRLILYDLPGAPTTAWTKATLDTIQIGVRQVNSVSDISQVTVLWLLVDHKPAAAGASRRIFVIS